MSGRLDVELATRGLARSRSHARSLIDNGRVLVNGRSAAKASLAVDDHDRLELTEADPYVSRAAYKLLGALDDLGVDVPPLALDAGASTGGFTQVLLHRGCRQVIAVDVGHDQLDPVLRNDPRVTSYEGLNLRDLDPEAIGGRPVDLVVADVSFISLTLLLGPLTSVIKPDGRLLTMIKPQFEVGRELLGKGGVVRAARLREQAVRSVIHAAAALGWWPQDAVPSRVPGPAGNVEYFVLFGHADGDDDPAGDAAGSEVMARLFHAQSP
ncbi:TlyA family RNA methyltransferase [Microlunatus sp. Gsoil 973]|uniref:TlyA family RNA methyltransferase n=1 Tax=Microlunatus sp. Gsoil 973 TaxID=2672569 RepID=UPI0012B4C573|nr:TlyA family RNA methyltransferase [Microlunatus sp. Gsoil 973]QGN33159.1 TlyA family rRNA (cytidine-2'-O)-methyltransferase [Microlunatus sp. Gsoil 973]